jgi:hypothetical protein
MKSSTAAASCGRTRRHRASCLVVGDKPKRLSVVLAALTLGGFLATAGRSAAAALAPTGAAKAASRWQLYPGKTDAGSPLLAIGWAANRVWLVTPYKEVPILRSAQPSGPRLSSFAQTRVPVEAGIAVPFPIVDGELLVPKNHDGTVGYATAPLLADGRLGASKAVPYDDLLARAKQSAAAKLANVRILDGLRVGGRVVWALEGSAGAVGLGSFFACCSESGAAVNLTRFVDRHVGVRFLHLGLDTHGRLWLAWLDRRNYPQATRGTARILELDPSTLAPRSNAVAIPGVIADRVELACADECRLVAQSAAGDIVSWAPGDRSPVRVASALRLEIGREPAWLLAASYRSGQLVVAFQRAKIQVVRGDARGARARQVAAIPVASSWPPTKVSSGPSGPDVHATFVPGGLVAVETFQFIPGYGPSPLIGVSVPLGR